MLFIDTDGKLLATRDPWWSEEPRTFRRVVLAPVAVMEQLPDVPVPADRRTRPYAGPPVFFGHYMLATRPAPLAPQIACVDYSAGNGGRWWRTVRWGNGAAGDASHLVLSSSRAGDADAW